MNDQTSSPVVRALTLVVGHVLKLVEQFDLALLTLDDSGGPLTLDDPS